MHDQNLHPVTGSRALVVCIGNELVADDAVGHAIFNRLVDAKLPEQIRIAYCGVGGIALLELLNGQDQLMIVVDAVQLGAAPGTVHAWSWSELPDIHDGNAISAHGIGLKDAMAIGQALYPERMPERVLLVGIEGRDFETLGAPLTPAVAASVPTVVDRIYNELKPLFMGYLGEQP